MRRITVNTPSESWWDSWQADCSKATSRLIAEMQAGRNPTINSELYRRHKYQFLMAPDGPFREKCAYCERDLSSQNGDVEHFRPKKGTTDVDDLPVIRYQDGRREAHTGYYWLSYEWRNLLPSCQICNVGNRGKAPTSKPGKRNRFPVEGTRAWSPGDEAYESPMLLNPTVDEPADHLIFDRTGAIGWVTERGKVTVAILGLNEYGLIEKRGAHYRLMKATVNRFIERHRPESVDDEAAREISRAKIGYGQYTAFSLLAISDALEEAQARFDDARSRLSS